MAKRKEIRFRDRGYTLEGRKGNLIFYLYDDNTQTDLDTARKMEIRLFNAHTGKKIVNTVRRD